MKNNIPFFLLLISIISLMILVYYKFKIYYSEEEYVKNKSISVTLIITIIISLFIFFVILLKTNDSITNKKLFMSFCIILSIFLLLISLSLLFDNLENFTLDKLLLQFMTACIAFFLIIYTVKFEKEIEKQQKLSITKTISHPNYIDADSLYKEINLNKTDECVFTIVGKSKSDKSQVPLQNVQYEYFSIKGNKSLIEIIEKVETQSEFHQLIIKSLAEEAEYFSKEDKFISLDINVIADNADSQPIYFRGYIN